MPVIQLNNAATADGYTDANTVLFSFPKVAFALNVTNAAIYYKLLLPGGTGRAGDYVEDSLERFLAPSMSNFRSPADEGFTGIDNFAGVKVRSAVAGTPAAVTVI